MDVPPRPTLPPNVTHFCRACGQPFASKGGTTAHQRVRKHAARIHNHKIVARCHANCSFKASYFEKQLGRPIRGVIPPTPDTTI